MKAAVLARGLARRMRAEAPGASLTGAQAEAAAAGAKAMMPVGVGPDGSPIPLLDFILSEMADAGVREVALVVGPDHGALRVRYEDVAPPRRVRVRWVVQPEALGTANAVAVCESWAEGQAFLVMNGDNLYAADAIRPLVALDEPGLPAFEARDLVTRSHIPVDRLAAFALLEIGPDGYLDRIVEKPAPATLAAAGLGARVSMNCWRFDRRIFECCRDVPRSARHEFELPMAVALAIERGIRFRAVPVAAEVLDLSARADVAAVSSRLAGRRPHP